MIGGHGGNTHALARELGCTPEAILDMSSNVNPFGPPPGLLDHLRNHLERVRALPEADAGSAVLQFAAHYGIPPGQVLAGNGTTQLIYDLPRALGMRRVLIVGPTYADYRDGCRQSGAATVFWLARPQDGFRIDLEAVSAAAAECDGIYICNPNNPTGRLVEREALRRLSRTCADKTLVVDESYLPFVDNDERFSLIAERAANVVVLHSMSKIFRVPGLRIGFVAASPSAIGRLRRYALPWSVNALAMAAVQFLLRPDPVLEAFIRDTRRQLRKEQETMRRALSAIPGLRCFPSATGFFLVQLPEPWRSSVVWQQLALRRILVRDCANFEGLSDRFIRISLQDAPSNARCAESLAGILAVQGPA